MTYSPLSNDLLGVTHYDLREDAFHLILILLQIYKLFNSHQISMN